MTWNNSKDEKDFRLHSHQMDTSVLASSYNAVFLIYKLEAMRQTQPCYRVEYD